MDYCITSYIYLSLLCLELQALDLQMFQNRSLVEWITSRINSTPHYIDSSVAFNNTNKTHIDDISQQNNYDRGTSYNLSTKFYSTSQNLTESLITTEESSTYTTAPHDGYITNTYTPESSIKQPPVITADNSPTSSPNDGTYTESQDANSEDISSALLTTDESEYEVQHKSKMRQEVAKIRGYPPHAIHGLIWEEHDNMVSVLLPIGCGIMGALALVFLAFAFRNCRKDQRVIRVMAAPPLINAPSVSQFDHVLLLAESSEDEEV